MSHSEFFDCQLKLWPMTAALDQDSFAWSQAILNEHTKFAEPVETFEPMLQDTVNVLPYKYLHRRFRQDICKTRFHQEFRPAHFLEDHP